MTVKEVVAKLKSLGTEEYRLGMTRFAIPNDGAYGVPVGVMRDYAKKLGKNHDLAAELWATGQYEARMMACFLDDPKLVTVSQMDAWVKAFDSWAICDTACFALFDRTPHAWAKVRQYAKRKPEFEKRAAFAILAGLTLREKTLGDDAFIDVLPLIEKAADDERNFVKKAVNWALRCIGKKNPILNEAAVEVSRRLSESSVASERWIGKDALRELTSDAVRNRLAKKRKA